MSLNRNGFQTFVNRHLAPGVVGAFASMNPRATVLAGPGSFRADEIAPVVVGRFAWAAPATNLAYGNQVASSFLGFVANEGQTVFSSFLSISRLTVQGGFPVTLYSHGDFWTYVNEARGVAVAVNDSIYAVASTGEPITTATSFSGTAAVATTVMTVSAVVSGAIRIGDIVAGANVTVGTRVTSFGTGTGGVGTYNVDTSQTAASAAVTVASVATNFVAATASPAAVTAAAASLAATGVLTTGTIVGTIDVGDGNSTVVNSTNTPANTFIMYQISGTAGAAGTYMTTSRGVVVAAEAMTFSTGRLVKITRTY